ncbi:hypothetical protein ACQV88_26540, partial [Ralstonia pseudosolanacearum]|uniref:hypothetical protein n=1 Tax=Ralstonia pseudosolanacearum TaxID=1310165 RepID=UPI003D2BDB8E
TGGDLLVKPEEVLQSAEIADPEVKTALLVESNTLAQRFALASAMLARGYASDPEKKSDPITTLQQAQHSSFHLEDIPRYDHLFVII